MPGLDTSFYPKPSAGQTNPMGMLSNYVGIGNQLLQRQIMAGEYGMKKESFEAQKLIGQAAMESTNPDGSIDMAGFQKRISEMPEGIQRHAWDAIEKATQRQATIAQTRMQEMQTEQLEREMIAKEAAGHILQAATDPETGAFNFDQALGIMVSDPAFRPYAGYMMKEFVETGKVSAEAAATKFATAKGKTEALTERLAPIAKKAMNGEDVPEGEIHSLISFMYASGQLDADTAAAATKEFSALPPDQRRQSIIQFVEGTQTGLDNLRAMEGDDVTIDTGGGVYREKVTPQGRIPLGTLDKSLTPEAASELIPMGRSFGEDGTMQTNMVRRGTLENQLMQATQGQRQPVQSPNMLTGGTVDMPQGPNILTGGGMPPIDEAALPYLQQEAMPQEEMMAPDAVAPQMPQPQVDPLGTLQISEPSEIEVERRSLVQKDFYKAKDEAKLYAEEAGKQMHRIQLAAEAMKHAQFGKSANARKIIADLAQFMGDTETADAIMARGDTEWDAKDAYAWTEVFQKLAVENTMNNLRQAIGGQGRLTNLEFEQFLKSYPNIGTDPRAIQKLFDMAGELSELAIMKHDAMTKWAKNPANSNNLDGFEAQWNKFLVEKKGWFKQDSKEAREAKAWEFD